jgi:hypothetical protein
MDTTISKSLLINELSSLITKGNAHATFEDAVANIPLDKLAITPENLPYNLWQLTEHIRIDQWDIVEFCMNPRHRSPEWPDEYWPDAADIPDQIQWETCLKQIKADRERFIQFLHDPSIDLSQALAHGTGQNILREALLIADHNAYHVGQIIVLRRLLKIWEE